MKPEYFKAICKLAVHGAQNLPDETAGTVPELYPDYEWLVQSNVRVKKAQLIFRYGDKLYRTVKNNTKFDGKNVPGEDGGKYFREVIPETGRTENTEIGKTNENPISVTSEEISAGYTFKYGYFYEYDGIVYRCIGKNGKGVDGEEYDLTETPDNSKYFEVAW